MNEKPQETQAGEQQDLLEQIIAHGLEKMNSPAQATAAEELPGSEASPAPKQEDSGGAAPTAGAKSRRTAVYLYLLILFGAAFMMLLLAYFVQQRSNETTISDLKDSMNLSREELLDEIKGLQGEITELQSENEDWASRYSQLEEQVEQYQQENNNLSTMYADAMKYYFGWEYFWELEQSYRAGDYESCAALLILQWQRHEHYTPDDVQERYEEIVQAVIDRGILDEDYLQHPEDYSELLGEFLRQQDFIISGSFSGRQEP